MKMNFVNSPIWVIDKMPCMKNKTSRYQYAVTKKLMREKSHT